MELNTADRHLGVGIGECLGYLLTGGWSLLIGVAMVHSSAFEAWLGWPGIITGLFLVVGSLEFVGRYEEQGWRRAGVPITYIAWSLWLILSGLVFLSDRQPSRSTCSEFARDRHRTARCVRHGPDRRARLDQHFILQGVMTTWDSC